MVQSTNNKDVINTETDATAVHPIVFVSLGPGEPELITVKGLRILNEADTIFCPATGSSPDKQDSKAAEIVRALGIGEEKIRLFHLPMNRERADAIRAYDDLCQEVSCMQANGLHVVITAEGDAGFYSSSQYAYEKLAKQALPVCRVPGIPAFIAAGALSGLHLAFQEQRMAVFPGNVSEEELDGWLAQGNSAVIMKLSSCAEMIQAYVRRNPRLTFHYFEHIGMDDEYYTCDTETIASRRIPYFSLLLIPNNNDSSKHSL